VGARKMEKLFHQQSKVGLEGNMAPRAKNKIKWIHVGNMA
jgi:hypothetical protein